MVSHLHSLRWLLTGLTTATTTPTPPHMPHAPTNPSCTLSPGLLAFSSKTQSWLGRCCTSFRTAAVGMKAAVLGSARRLHGLLHHPALLRALTRTVQHPRGGSQDALFLYVLFYKPLLGQPVPGKCIPGHLVCPTPGPFCLRPGAFSNL